MNILSKFNGIKTYMSGVAMILTGAGMAIAVLSTGTFVGIDAGITLILNGVGLIGLRHGVAKINTSEDVSLKDVLDKYLSADEVRIK